MDDLIRGWIPNRLLDILKQKKVKGSMKDIEKLISDWVMEIVKFIKGLWQRRNDDLAKWEKFNNITKAEKRKVRKNKKSQNEQKKGKFLVNEAIIIISLMIKYMKLLNEQ